MYSRMPNVDSKLSVSVPHGVVIFPSFPFLFCLRRFMKALKRAIFSGNSVAVFATFSCSNSKFPFSTLPVRFMAVAIIASFIVEGLGAGALRA